MFSFRFPRPRRSPWELLRSALLAFFLVAVLQFALAMVPRIFQSFSLVAMLPIAGIILVATILLGRLCKKIVGVSASAPAFVLFNILFLWGIYIVVIRKATPSLLDAILNAECALILFGLYRIFSDDPGIVSSSSSAAEVDQQNFVFNVQYESTSTFSRVRYCTSCKSNIRGFDHHCPAFGNCIGQKNHHLFIALLTGFIIAESSYTMCSTKFIAKYAETQQIEAIPASSLVISTMLFCVLQLLWQVVFLIWHIYCICVNIKTDEWINWRKYPEFQIIIEPEQGCPAPETRFTNPYDKGLFSNIIEFLKTKG